MTKWHFLIPRRRHDAEAAEAAEAFSLGPRDQSERLDLIEWETNEAAAWASKKLHWRRSFLFLSIGVRKNHLIETRNLEKSSDESRLVARMPRIKFRLVCKAHIWTIVFVKRYLMLRYDFDRDFKMPIFWNSEVFSICFGSTPLCTC